MKKIGEELEQKIVFLADECEISAKLLTGLLLKQGYKILKFNSGTELLDSLLKGAYPDMLIMGIVLPGISSIELLARLAAAHVKIPAILMGTAAYVDEISKASDYGVVDFILKPFDLKEVAFRLKLSLAKNFSLETSHSGTA